MTRLFVTLTTALAFTLTSCTQPPPLPRECVYRTPDGTIATGACP